MKIRSMKDLEKIKEEGKRLIYPEKTKITIGMSTCNIATGSENVLKAVEETVKRNNLDVVISKSACMGFCQIEPIMDIIQPGKPRIIYQKLNPLKVSEIIDDLSKGSINTKYAFYKMDIKVKDDSINITSYKDIGFYNKQEKIVLEYCGIIDPESIEEYIATDGYFALHKVLTAASPEQIIENITKSGLRGRGGGGFPAGIKWNTTKRAPGEPKYVVCNADEGDPGAYMDRSLLEGNPHSVLEGMIIGAYAIGSSEGYVYVRTEYPLAVQNINIAISRAKEMGLLGENILGSGFNFDLKVVRGAGAFVCGESTALFASVEGRVGEPRAKYIRSAEKGLWDKPTNLNNVETWANVPLIINRGVKWYTDIGTEGSKGTKIFSLVGKINNTGLVEVSMGATLRQIIYDIGGGIPKGRKFKAVQTGGPSGGCLPEEFLDIPVDFDELTKVGSMMGSGGMIVMDDRTCMVDVAKFFLDFLKDESCGKCVPCREGVVQMHAILTDICNGVGKEEDIEILTDLSLTLKDAALCALGTTAANPVLSTLKHFENEYYEHIRDKKCCAGVCKELVTYAIDSEKCKGCGLCAKDCPQDAITGEKGKAYSLDISKCVKCGVCFEACKFEAVIVK
ncbi:MAG: NADH-quinone oxidoreductase subunit NuoF [bacterium]|nr:NADH-quinone oxidoreductase subunit NuoF [bacterium]